jgi:hypothetical protein
MIQRSVCLGFGFFLAASLSAGLARSAEAVDSTDSKAELEPLAGGACAAAAWSSTAVYVGGNVVSFNGNQYTAAYWNQNAEPDKNDGAQYSGQPWSLPTPCSATACTPNCGGKQCGADGCGGTCGTCGASQTCNASDQCVASCLPSCEMKGCGSDGCGGSCGTCAAGLTCNAGNQCVAPCVPQCSGKQCGGDTCGGSCGTCGAGSTCDADGTCELTADVPPPPLAVPLDPQIESEWCWAASAQMIITYLGGSVQQCQEANYRFGLTDCCTNAADESSLTECNQPGWPNWNYWGYNFSETAIGSSLSFAQLQTEFAANRPVGFAWAWSTGGGHYMVATGTQVEDGTEYVTINDPWAPNVGEQVTLTYEDWVAGPAGTDPTATASYTHMADDYGIQKQ